jgi:phosphoglucomutase
MAGLIAMRDRFDVAVGNDPDADRHGIVTPSSGLMNPNHFLAVAIWYLFRHRPRWRTTAGIGKTLVSSSMIDRIASHLGRPLVEVPVGFKWFVDGLASGALAFAGEESAGASFATRRHGVDHGQGRHHPVPAGRGDHGAAGSRPRRALPRSSRSGSAAPCTNASTPRPRRSRRRRSRHSRPESITADELAGDAITERLTRAPGNGAAIGGIKVVTEYGWFAARARPARRTSTRSTRKASGRRPPPQHPGGGPGVSDERAVPVGRPLHPVGEVAAVAGTAGRLARRRR